MRLLPSDSDSVLAIERCFGGERLVAVFNFADMAAPALSGEDGSYADLWTGRQVNAEGLSVPAGGFMWLCER